MLFQQSLGDSAGNRPIVGLRGLQIGRGVDAHDGHGRRHDQTQNESDSQRPTVAAELCHDACHSFILPKKAQPDRSGFDRETRRWINDDDEILKQSGATDGLKTWHPAIPLPIAPWFGNLRFCNRPRKKQTLLARDSVQFRSAAGS